MTMLKRRSRSSAFVCSCTLLLVAAVPLPTLAQAVDSAASSDQLEEVVVTAEKRISTVSRTPIAVTAIKGEDLADHELNAITDLQGAIPNFRIGMLTGGAVVSIRGIGIQNVLPTVEGAAAININDVYVAPIIAQPLSFFDVSSLEVLRGPQGTLYGRNATAGAVNIHTVLPDDKESGYARVTLGNYETTNVEGALGGPVADNVFVRIATRIEHHGGYATNIADGHSVDDRDTWAVRGTVVAKPADNVTATLIVEGGEENDNSGALHYFGGGGLTGLPGASGLQPLWIQEGGIDPGIRNVNNQVDPVMKLLTDSVTGRLEWQPTAETTLRSITGYRQMRNSQVIDVDDANPSSIFFALDDQEAQVSEELQALYSSPLVDVTLGAFYFHNDETVAPADVAFNSSFLTGFCTSLGFSCPAVQATPYFTDALPYRAHQLTESEAGFGQVDYHLTQLITVTAGLRFTSETKRMAQNVTPNFSNSEPLTQPYIDFEQYYPYPLGPARSVTYHATTPKFGLQYQVTPNVLLYASYSRGFKSGGFEISQISPPFQPERLTDYEGGLKARLLNGKLTANLAGFHYNYDNLQVQVQNGQFALSTVNAAKATIDGAEAEIMALPLDRVRVDLSGAWLHAVYDQYLGVDSDRPQLGNVDYSGHYLSNAPAVSLQFGTQYSWPVRRGGLTLRGELQYMSRYYLTPVNVDLESQAAFTKGNLFLTYTDDADWKVEIYARNVGNLITKESYQSPGAPFGNPFGGSVSAPRLIGADLSYHF